MLFRTAISCQHCQLDQQRADWIRHGSGCGEHVAEVSSGSILHGLRGTTHMLLTYTISPRPTPEVVPAIAQNPQSHDCVQVRVRHAAGEDCFLKRLPAANGVDIRERREGV